MHAFKREKLKSHLHACGHGRAPPHGDASAVALSQEVVADVLHERGLHPAAAAAVAAAVHEEGEHGSAFDEVLLVHRLPVSGIRYPVSDVRCWCRRMTGVPPNNRGGGRVRGRDRKGKDVG